MNARHILPALLLITTYLPANNYATTLDSSSANKFRVFEATKYKNKPDMSEFNIQKLGLLYDHEFWKKKENRDELPKDKTIERLARKYSKYEYIVLDIEHWKTQGYRYRPWIPQNNIEKYIYVFNEFKKYTPNSKVGYFAKVPVSNYKLSLSKPGDELHDRWAEENKKMKPIADIVDVAYPSTYTYEKDWCKWEQSFISKLNQMKKIHKGEFFPFIWPQYHEKPVDKSIRLKYIDFNFWLFQLVTTKKHADGVVIWGGWDFHQWTRKTWDSNTEWWAATRYFIKNQNSEELLNMSCIDQHKQLNIELLP